MLPIREKRLAKLDPFALLDLHHRPETGILSPDHGNPGNAGAAMTYVDSEKAGAPPTAAAAVQI